MRITLTATGPHAYYGSIHINNELIFCISAPDIAICCSFIMQHKQFLDNTCSVVEEVEIAPLAEMH